MGASAARVSSETLSELEPAEYRADAVFELVIEGEDRPTRALIVEVQLRPDPAKRLTWPMYQAGLRRRLRCPVLLILVAPTASTARWCAEAIDLDGLGGSVIRPLVVGPGNTPLVTTTQEAARAPELAVLSVIAHGNSANGVAVGRAALAACRRLDDERSRLYVDLILLHLSAAARTALEGEMDLKDYEYQSEFARKYMSRGRAEGRAEGELEAKADAVLTVLEARGLAVTPAVRERIAATTELPVLQHWLVRAATVASTDDIFGA